MIIWFGKVDQLTFQSCNFQRELQICLFVQPPYNKFLLKKQQAKNSKNKKEDIWHSIEHQFSVQDFEIYGRNLKFWNLFSIFFLSLQNTKRNLCKVVQ